MPGSGPGLNSTSGAKTVGKILSGSSRRKRLVHVFSELFYDTHVKPHVDYSAYLASVAEETTPPMAEFAYRNTCTKRAWENASPDIRQQVIDYKKLKDMPLEELERMVIDDEEECSKRNTFF